MLETTFEPIDAALQYEVCALTENYIDRAARQFARTIGTIPIYFDLSGTTAGMFVVKEEGPCIRYNPWIFAKYYQENLQGTVPHEVAHYIVWVLYGNKRGIKPHGREWQEVMELFNADTTVTCNFDFSGVPQKRQRRFVYYCQCRIHELSTTVHNRIQKRRYQYICQYCHATLKKKRKKVSAKTTIDYNQMSLF